ncbi:MAG: 30S ribosomal protein S8e [Candidatus Pacearchaeota archaeon]|jgi:small subunit ribosomal protein S8e
MGHGRKITGGKYKAFSKRKKYAIPGTPRKVKLRENKSKVLRGLGGSKKTVLLSADHVNVIDTKTKKTKKVKIKNVIETPSNKFLARQNILIKGAIIETDLGKAKITNRPGQEGQINAILLKE